MVKSGSLVQLRLQVSVNQRIFHTLNTAYEVFFTLSFF